MTKREEYEAKTEQLIMPILEANNFELYDVEYVKEVGTWYLRVYIDKEGGISVEDCELVSRAMNEILDEKDYIPDAYIFEVSSPGLGRQLKKDKHLAKSIGEEVEIKTFKAINKQKDFDGILRDFDKDKLVIELEDGSKMEFARTDIAMVRLALDF
ncbi:MAG: ribosome maturation factor RimP [Clostridiales bacterium]|nr:ribosome maturation factor RimP [Clostridiales bacterium]